LDAAPSMLIENFITYAARRKNFRYLQFSPASTLSALPSADNTPRLLYIHVPFCEELCPYCSFHRVVFQEGLARAYFDALRKEIIMYKELGYSFNAVYVGGGTPTILIEELAETLALAGKSFPIREISVETNPNHLTDSNISILKSAGVNRLSVGVQSFDDGLLKAAERYHKYGSGEEIARKLKSTQGHFDTLNVDMIFNFPSQTMAMLEKDLSVLLDLGVDQITYYPLMPSSYAMEAMRKKLGGSVDFKREKKFYMKITGMLEQQYCPSTAWCFSKGASMIDEYVVHFAEYAGIGSGSIGYLQGTVYANTFDIGEYIERVNKGAFPFVGRKESSLSERLRYEFLIRLFGLRLDLTQLKNRFGTNASRWLWSEILFFRMTGGLKKEGQMLTLTRIGRYYWVIMMREFFIGVNNFRDFCRANLKAVE
jgi:menaquinone C8-methyltransferase